MEYRIALIDLILNDWADNGETLSSLLATIVHGTKGLKNMEIDELEQMAYDMYSDDIEMDNVDPEDSEKLKAWVIDRAKGIQRRAQEYLL